jgi:hypothetical protein
MLVFKQMFTFLSALFHCKKLCESPPRNGVTYFGVMQIAGFMVPFWQSGLRVWVREKE